MSVSLNDQWWPYHVQELEQALYFNQKVDTWIFRNRDDGTYFTVGGIDALGVTTILMVADLCKFTSQRMRSVDYSPGRGFFHA